MKPYSLTTQYKSWTKKTLISILDEIGHTDYRTNYNKAELANEIVQYYNVETVLNAADNDALRRLFDVVGAEEIYRVVEIEGGATPSPQDLSEEVLRNILVQFQKNMQHDAAELYFSDTTNKDYQSLFLSISLDTWTEEQWAEMEEIIYSTDDSK